MKSKKLINNKGFTLIELIIALSIISIISMAFFTTINSNIKYNSKNEKDIKALNIAQTEIENIRYCVKENKTIFIKDDVIEDNQLITNEREISFDEVNEYSRIMPDEYIEYKIKLSISKTEKGSENITNKFNIYNVEIQVELENKNLSKKITKLTTDILSK